MKRCKWTAAITDEEYLRYHDEEWSEPLTDDRDLFELLSLEGAQAGLSWQTILKKRTNYRKCFINFDLEKVGKLRKKDIAKILDQGGVVKHSGKIKSVISNAIAFKKVINEFGSLHEYFQFYLNDVDVFDPLVTQTPISPASTMISKDMKKRGFNFVGPTVIQAFLQASGLYKAHDSGCFKHIVR